MRGVYLSTPLPVDIGYAQSSDERDSYVCRFTADVHYRRARVRMVLTPASGHRTSLAHVQSASGQLGVPPSSQLSLRWSLLPASSTLTSAVPYSLIAIDTSWVGVLTLVRVP